MRVSPSRPPTLERFVLLLTLAAVVLLAGNATPASADPPALHMSPAHGAGFVDRQLIVRFHTTGPFAVTECAETLLRQRRAFRGATADRSESLDRLATRLGVRQARALFRRPDGTGFGNQRMRLQRRLARAQGRRGGRGARPLPDLSHVYLVELGANVDVASATELYRADPHVAWAQPNFTATTTALPNDPFLRSSGSWGQPYPDLWTLSVIRAHAAWNVTLGAGQVVAVVDSGLDYLHPDIADNVWVHPGEDLNGNGRVDPGEVNGIDDDGNGFVDDLRGFDFANSFDADLDGRFDGPTDVSDPDPFDDLGHGTHVAGTIAATADNGIGIAGVAPGAQIMALKGIGGGGTGSIDGLARAIVYAAENGADVINNSWSCTLRCPRTRSPRTP